MRRIVLRFVVFQRGDEPPAVVDSGPYEDVEIAGEARSPMKGQGVAVDTHELNMAGVQTCAELAELWR